MNGSYSLFILHKRGKKSEIHESCQNKSPIIIIPLWLKIMHFFVVLIYEETGE